MYSTYQLITSLISILILTIMYFLIFPCMVPLILVESSVIYQQENTKYSKGNQDTCLTKECITLASRILSFMNETSDPCQDFYEYSCGSWLNDETNEIFQLNIFDTLYQKNQYRMKYLLETLQEKDLSDSQLKAKIFYNSCLAEDMTDGFEKLETYVNELRFFRSLVAKIGTGSDEDWVISDDQRNDMTPFNDVLGSKTKIKVPVKIVILPSSKITDYDSSKNYYLKNDLTFEKSVPLQMHNMDKFDPGNSNVDKSLPPIIISDMIKSFEQNKTNLQAIIEALQKDYGVDALFTISVKQDEYNSSRNILALSQGATALSADMYRVQSKLEQRVLDNYLALMVKVCVKLFDMEESAAEIRMKNVIAFETELTKISEPEINTFSTNIYEKKLKLMELNQILPQIDWPKLMRNIFASNDVDIDSNEEVVLIPYTYFEKLNEFLKNMDDDFANRTLFDYIIWQLVYKFLPYLPEPISAQINSVSEVPRWIPCLSETNRLFGFPLGALYIERYFNESKRQKILGILNSIRVSYEKQIKESNWLEETAKLNMLTKLRAMRKKVGITESLSNISIMNDFYRELKVEPGKFLENTLNTILLHGKYIMKSLKLPYDKDSWDYIPLTVNAYYKASANEMVFPIGILQEPLLTNEKLRGYDYGALGFVTAHEMVHSFDVIGMQYDENGNYVLLKNTSTSFINAFENHTQCLRNQYSAFLVGGEQINGNVTIAENIADNGGLRAAFKAFQESELDLSRINSNEYGLKLPGLNLTQTQLFFLSFAQVWCVKQDKATMHYNLKRDTHSPNKIRVMGTLANMNEFSQAFNCPTKSGMNPTKKCYLW